MLPNKGESFEGRASDMKDSDWLAVEDIADTAPVKVKIENVLLHKNVAFEGGRKEPRVFSIAFEKGSKQLPLNATNRKALQRAFGNDVAKWRGKDINLTVEPLKRAFNGHTHGIRIQVIA